MAASLTYMHPRHTYQLRSLSVLPYQVDDMTLKASIRRATVALKFVPVFMGSAYKNKVSKC